MNPRLAQAVVLPSGGTQVTLPLPPGAAQPTFFVPSESSQLTIAAESMTPTVPISMDIYDTNGAPPYGMPGPGGPGCPDVEAQSFVDPFSQAYAAVASISRALLCSPHRSTARAVLGVVVAKPTGCI